MDGRQQCEQQLPQGCRTCEEIRSGLVLLIANTPEGTSSVRIWGKLGK